jgi:mRNA interferase MazF
LKIGGAILSDQVKSLDWKVRQAEFISKLPAPTLDEVLQKLGTLIGR